MEKHRFRRQNGEEVLSRNRKDFAEEDKWRSEHHLKKQRTMDRNRERERNFIESKSYLKRPAAGAGAGVSSSLFRRGIDPGHEENIKAASSSSCSASGIYLQHSSSFEKNNGSCRGEPKNFRLACFLANEYLSRGTILNRSWPPSDAKPDLSCKTSDSEKKLQQRRYYFTVCDLLRSGGDVQIPGIVNPTQLADWLGLAELNSSANKD